MEAFTTERNSKKSGRVPYIEKAFLGRQSEARVEEELISRGFRILQRNLRFDIGEIDILAEDSARRIFVVEVRSRRDSKRRPSRYLSNAKIRRLKTLGRLVSQRYGRPAVVELWEVIGREMNRFRVE